MKYELIIKQINNRSGDLLQELRHTRETKEEILELILSFSDCSKDFKSSHLLFEMEEK